VYIILYLSQYHLVISVISIRFILHIPKLLRYDPILCLDLVWWVLGGKILFIIIRSHHDICDIVMEVSKLRTIASNRFLILFL